MVSSQSLKCNDIFGVVVPRISLALGLMGIALIKHQLLQCAIDNLTLLSFSWLLLVLFITILIIHNILRCSSDSDFHIFKARALNVGPGKRYHMDFTDFVKSADSEILNTPGNSCNCHRTWSNLCLEIKDTKLRIEYWYLEISMAKQYIYGKKGKHQAPKSSKYTVWFRSNWSCIVR